VNVTPLRPIYSLYLLNMYLSVGFLCISALFIGGLSTFYTNIIKYVRPRNNRTEMYAGRVASSSAKCAPSMLSVCRAIYWG